MTHHAPLAEETGRKFEAVEPVHVAGGISAREADRRKVRLLGGTIGSWDDLSKAGRLRGQPVQEIELLLVHDRLRILACGKYM